MLTGYIRDLSQAWRKRLDQLESAAKGYNGKCMTQKGMQLILLANQLRGCIGELEKGLSDSATEASPDDTTAILRPRAREYEETLAKTREA